MAVFSTTIDVPLNKLKEASKKLNEYAEDNEDIFDRLINVMTAMESSGEWSGKSMKAALSSIQKNRKKYSTTINDLNNLAKFLSDFTKEMEEKDTEIAGEIRNS